MEGTKKGEPPMYTGAGFSLWINFKRDCPLTPAERKALYELLKKGTYASLDVFGGSVKGTKLWHNEQRERTETKQDYDRANPKGFYPKKY